MLVLILGTGFYLQVRLRGMPVLRISRRACGWSGAVEAATRRTAKSARFPR